MKILVVDDDPTALNILELALQTAGYDDFDLAASAAEALEYLEIAKRPYDCLLLDIIMPEMDGVELCRHVRGMSNYANVPIIMITASQHKDTLTSAIASGATDYVNKPFDGLELVTRLRAAESLMKATKAANTQLRRATVPPEKKTDSSLQLADCFALDAKQGLVSQANLVCEFVDTAQFLKSMHAFAVAISNVKRLFEAMSEHEFRAFVNELAAALSRLTRSWDPRITYAGDGTFIVVLFDVGFLSRNDLHKILKAGLGASAFETLTSCACETHICVNYVVLSDPDDHVQVDELFKAAADAKRKASSRKTDERELEIRYRLLGRAKLVPSTHYEVSLTRTAPKKIFPRRLSKNERGAFEAEQGSADKRIPISAEVRDRSR